MPNFLVTAVPDTRSSKSVPFILMPATPPAAAIFHSTIHPPPTPVETVTYARDLAPLPAPACASPRPASAASLTTCAGTPKASVSSRTIFIPSQARRLRASDMTPLSLTLPETQPATAVICPSPPPPPPHPTTPPRPPQHAYGPPQYPLRCTWWKLLSHSHAAGIGFPHFFIERIRDQCRRTAFINDVVREAPHLLHHLIIRMTRH